jgi:hypothetical protein
MSSVSFMALDAQLLFAIKSQPKLVRAAHQFVTGDTSNIPLRPWIDDAVPNGMGKLGMSLVTRRANEKFLIAKKESEIGPVGAMTGAALSLLDQGMFVVILFIFRTALSVPMATEANPDLFGLLQVTLIRGMGGVTAHAKDTFVHVAVDLLEIFSCGRVAGKAGRRPFALESQRILGPAPVVTTHAFVLGKRLVEMILDQAGAVRPVGGVARHTVGALHRVTKMSFLCLLVLD